MIRSTLNNFDFGLYQNESHFSKWFVWIPTILRIIRTQTFFVQNNRSRKLTSWRNNNDGDDSHTSFYTNPNRSWGELIYMYISPWFLWLVNFSSCLDVFQFVTQIECSALNHEVAVLHRFKIETLEKKTIHWIPVEIHYIHKNNLMFWILCSSILKTNHNNCSNV